MPSHFAWLPAPVRRWMADSPPMTRREFYALFGLLFLLVTLALVGVGDQIRRNRDRDHAIEASRLASCQTVYGSIEEVALFFFPPRGRRTARQNRIATNLHDFIQARSAKCRTQVKTATTKGAR